MYVIKSVAFVHICEHISGYILLKKKRRKLGVKINKVNIKGKGFSRLLIR